MVIRISAEDISYVIFLICELHNLPAFQFGLRDINPTDLFKYWTKGKKTYVYQYIQQSLEKNGLDELRRELKYLEDALYGIEANIRIDTKRLYGALQLTEIIPGLKQNYAMYHQTSYLHAANAPEPTWFSIDIDRIDWNLENRQGRDRQGEAYPYTRWVILPNQEWKFYSSHDLTNAVFQMITKDESLFDAVRKQLTYVCQALPKTPILGDSGEEETIYRPGPKKSHTERENEIANMLSGLPKLTACVKLNAFPPNLQSKVCHCCGKPKLPTANFCNTCGIRLQPEYTITITPNNQGMKPADLQARIDTITQKNVQDGYLRERSMVEAEILARQQQPPPLAQPQPAQPKPKTPSQSPAGAVQPPTIPTPRKRVIGTPITKQCPSCNAQNNPTALFCNMCGSQL